MIFHSQIPVAEISDYDRIWNCVIPKYAHLLNQFNQNFVNTFFKCYKAYIEIWQNPFERSDCHVALYAFVLMIWHCWVSQIIETTNQNYPRDILIARAKIGPNLSNLPNVELTVYHVGNFVGPEPHSLNSECNSINEVQIFNFFIVRLSSFVLEWTW